MGIRKDFFYGHYDISYLLDQFDPILDPLSQNFFQEV